MRDQEALRHERTIVEKRSVGRQHVQVGVEVRKIAERLHEQDQAGTGTGGGERVRLEEQARGDAAQVAEPCPMPAEERTQEPREREDVLPVGHGLEDVLLDPLAVQEHAFLVQLGQK